MITLAWLELHLIFLIRLRQPARLCPSAGQGDDSGRPGNTPWLLSRRSFRAEADATGMIRRRSRGAMARQDGKANLGDSSGRPACYVMICQWSILIFLSYRSAYSLPSKIYQDSVKVFNVCETLDHVQPAIRSSPIIWRDQVSECDGVDQTATRRGTPRRDRSHPFVMCV